MFDSAQLPEITVISDKQITTQTYPKYKLIIDKPDNYIGLDNVILMIGFNFTNNKCIEKIVTKLLEYNSVAIYSDIIIKQKYNKLINLQSFDIHKPQFYNIPLYIHKLIVAQNVLSYLYQNQQFMFHIAEPLYITNEG